MTNDAANPIADQDVISIADKLSTFAEALSAGEQAVLCRVIAQAARAAQADSEVAGYFTLIETPASLLTPDSLRASLLTAVGIGDGSVRPGQFGALLPAVQKQP